MAQQRRRRLLADRKLQGTLVVRAAVYWFYCLLAISLSATCWILFSRQPATSSDLFSQVWLNCGPALLGSVLLLPLVLMDCLRLSNRFAGPMVRIQHAMQQLARGQKPAAIHLRDGDFWSRFAEDFNRVLELCSAPPAGDEDTESPAAGPDDPTTSNHGVLVSAEGQLLSDAPALNSPLAGN